MVITKQIIKNEISKLNNTKEFKSPSSKVISELIFKELTNKHDFLNKDRSYIINNFSEILNEYRDLDWQILSSILEPKYQKMYKHFVNSEASKKNINKVDLTEFLLNDIDLFHYKYQLDISLSQSYKSRAGTSFEYIIEYLFELLNFEFEAQPKEVRGKPDFLFPTVEKYNNNPEDCLIIGAKTKIRERYRQIVSEGNSKASHYCFTLGEDLNESVINKGIKLGLIFVIPQNLKQEKFENKNIYSFEQFIKEHLENFKK
jgi:hypothetical protein